jgi:hypothetical protein
MKPLVRQLLLILVAIALPLQGLAAVTMGICGGEHHRVAVVTAPISPVASVQLEEHHDHHHAVIAQYDHQAEQYHQDHQHQPQHGSSDKQDKQKATCAACYAFSLPVSITLTTPALPPADHPVAALSRFTGFEPEGLERPPRSILL